MKLEICHVSCCIIGFVNNALIFFLFLDRDNDLHLEILCSDHRLHCHRNPPSRQYGDALLGVRHQEEEEVWQRAYS